MWTKGKYLRIKTRIISHCIHLKLLHYFNRFSNSPESQMRLQIPQSIKRLKFLDSIDQKQKFDKNELKTNGKSKEFKDEPTGLKSPYIDLIKFDNIDEINQIISEIVAKLGRPLAKTILKVFQTLDKQFGLNCLKKEIKDILN